MFETHLQLGLAYTQGKHWVAAEMELRQALALRPNHPDALNLLGLAAHEQGRSEEGLALIAEAIKVAPDGAGFRHSLGDVYRALGRPEEASACYCHAIGLDPDMPEPFDAVISILRQQKLVDQAVEICQHVLAVAPRAQVHLVLGTLLGEDLGRIPEAIEALRAAVAASPGLAHAHNNLGNCYKEIGDLKSAGSEYRLALQTLVASSTSVEPFAALVHSNLIYAQLFLPAATTTDARSEQADWWAWHAAGLCRAQSGSRLHQEPHARLRIGYVSPDFCDHVVGRNLLPLFDHHDRSRFEITCYSHVPRPDAFTQHFQAKADHWHDTRAWTDAQVAQQIREDGIDILVDLSLHMARNRLLIFAEKPAPVQVSFAGYPGSTGLETIDCRLTDPFLEPLDREEHTEAEQPYRLPHSFWCYEPVERHVPVNELPARRRGYVTFACLNTFCKVNEAALAVWAGVMRKVPDSRFFLLCPEGDHREGVRETFARHGISPQRIDFRVRRVRSAYLCYHHDADLMLDTFPYNGHTTTLDNLWMGVPVVTLAGATPVSRAGLSILSNLNLTELVARTTTEFEDITVELAGDWERLGELRQTLRARMESSVLMDAQGFARGVEDAYSRIWSERSEKANSATVQRFGMA